jgi:hypothetical protein
VISPSALFDHAHLTTGQTVLIHGAAGGTLVTIAMPPIVRPKDGRAIFEPDRVWLTDLGQRLRAGRLNPIVGAVRPLSETASRSPATAVHPARQLFRSRTNKKRSTRDQCANRQRRADHPPAGLSLWEA